MCTSASSRLRVGVAVSERQGGGRRFSERHRQPHCRPLTTHGLSLDNALGHPWRDVLPPPTLVGGDMNGSGLPAPESFVSLSKLSGDIGSETLTRIRHPPSKLVRGDLKQKLDS